MVGARTVSSKGNDSEINDELLQGVLKGSARYLSLLDQTIHTLYTPPQTWQWERYIDSNGPRSIVMLAFWD